MGAVNRNFLRARAGGRCEYCRLPEEAADLPLHIEHIKARKHGGDSSELNLAFACDRWK